MRHAAIAMALLVGACNDAPPVQLQVRLPADANARALFAPVTTLDLRAERDGRVLAEATFDAASTTYLSLSTVSRGPRTLLALDGLDASSNVLAHGATCPFDFEGPTTASLYFAPATYFGPTAGAPLAERDDPLALTRADGSVLVVGGLDVQNGGALASAEAYSPSTGTFAPAPQMLAVAREEPQVATVPGVGSIVVGGRDGMGQPIGTAEVWVDADGRFVAFDSPAALGPRAGHRVVTLADGRVLVTGGVSANGGAPLASNALINVQPDGSAVVTSAPPLVDARRAHAAVVAVGVAVVMGGYGTDGTPLASIEALATDGHGQPTAFERIASLQMARAESTITLLHDGSILVVGGAGDAVRTPRADAEVYNPITRQTTLYQLGFARRGHTATLLPDGRVLVVGGVGADGAPLSSVELFIPSVGFVPERPLGTARAEHVAVPLCDGTVLVVGGAPGAELYTPSSL